MSSSPAAPERQTSSLPFLAFAVVCVLLLVLPAILVVRTHRSVEQGVIGVLRTAGTERISSRLGLALDEIGSSPQADHSLSAWAGQSFHDSLGTSRYLSATISTEGVAVVPAKGRTVTAELLAEIQQTSIPRVLRDLYVELNAHTPQGPARASSQLPTVPFVYLSTEFGSSGPIVIFYPAARFPETYNIERRPWAPETLIPFEGLLRSRLYSDFVTAALIISLAKERSGDVIFLDITAGQPASTLLLQVLNALVALCGAAILLWHYRRTRVAFVLWIGLGASSLMCSYLLLVLRGIVHRLGLFDVSMQTAITAVSFLPTASLVAVAAVLLLRSPGLRPLNARSVFWTFYSIELVVAFVAVIASWSWLSTCVGVLALLLVGAGVFRLNGATFSEEAGPIPAWMAIGTAWCYVVWAASQSAVTLMVPGGADGLSELMTRVPELSPISILITAPGSFLVLLAAKLGAIAMTVLLILGWVRVKLGPSQGGVGAPCLHVASDGRILVASAPLRDEGSLGAQLEDVISPREIAQEVRGAIERGDTLPHVVAEWIASRPGRAVRLVVEHPAVSSATRTVWICPIDRRALAADLDVMVATDLLYTLDAVVAGRIGAMRARASLEAARADLVSLASGAVHETFVVSMAELVGGLELVAEQFSELGPDIEVCNLAVREARVRVSGSAWQMILMGIMDSVWWSLGELNRTDAKVTMELRVNDGPTVPFSERAVELRVFGEETLLDSRVAETYRRTGLANPRDVGGTGAQGLRRAKLLAEHFGGRIELDSMSGVARQVSVYLRYLQFTSS